MVIFCHVYVRPPGPIHAPSSDKAVHPVHAEIGLCAECGLPQRLIRETCMQKAQLGQCLDPGTSWVSIAGSLSNRTVAVISSRFEESNARLHCMRPHRMQQIEPRLRPYTRWEKTTAHRTSSRDNPVCN